jgi:hypothetical protein
MYEWSLRFRLVGGKMKKKITITLYIDTDSECDFVGELYRILGDINFSVPVKNKEVMIEQREEVKNL